MDNASIICLFRTRELLVHQRTQTINALRGHLAEFGLVAARAVPNVERHAKPSRGAERRCRRLQDRLRISCSSGSAC